MQTAVKSEGLWMIRLNYKLHAAAQMQVPQPNCHSCKNLRRCMKGFCSCSFVGVGRLGQHEADLQAGALKAGPVAASHRAGFHMRIKKPAEADKTQAFIWEAWLRV